MEYEYINSESYEEIKDFALYIIDYFDNDYLIIRDFLIKPSPWDDNILFGINERYIDIVPLEIIKDKSRINIKDLEKMKQKMLLEILTTYNFSIIIPFLEQFNLTNDDVSIASLDGTLIEKNKKASANPALLAFDDFYMLRLIQFYVKTLSIKTDYNFRINTYNQFKFDVIKIDKIFNEVANKYNIYKVIADYESNETIEAEEKMMSFNKELVNKVKCYINMNFRTKEDVYDFVNYLFSVVYAYLMVQKERGEEIEGIEEDIIDATEGAVNLTELFYSDICIASEVIEQVHDNIVEFGREYDLRERLKNRNQKDIMGDLDLYYGQKKKNDVVIHTYSIDFKLRNLILSLLIKNGIQNTFDILMDKTSLNDNLYDYLFELKLDARNSNFYKKEMIKKIVTDVLEYLNYKDRNEEDEKKYNEIKSLNSFFELLNFFTDNFTYLINTYLEYNRDCLFAHEKARFNCIKNKDIKKMEQLYFYCIDRYLEIFASKYNEIGYLDDLNKIIDNYYNNGVLSLNINDINKIIIYVYERLVCEKSLFKIPDEMRGNLLLYIEKRNDYSYVERNKMLDLIIQLFLKITALSFGNEDECEIRKNIKNKEKIKILENMKKYEQID